MATKEVATGITADQFGEGPHSNLADQVRREREKARKARIAAEKAKVRSTNPHHQSHILQKRLVLGVDPEVVKKFHGRGLELAWIRKEEWHDEYAEMGCKAATWGDIGKDSLSGGGPEDARPAGGTVTRRSMMLIIRPLRWKEERAEAEKIRTRQLADQDPFDEEFPQRPGEFGKGSRRRPSDPLDYDDGE